jgi:hypothetical protein
MLQRTLIAFVLLLATGFSALGDCTWVPASTTLTTTCGAIGLGTVNPQRRLHVIGSSDAVAAFPTAAIGPADVVVLENNANANLSFVASETGQSNIRFVHSGASAQSGAITYVHGTSHFMSFSTSSAERMRITSSGEVGIKTVSPLTTLDVAGKLRAIGENQAATLAGNGTDYYGGGRAASYGGETIYGTPEGDGSAYTWGVPNGSQTYYAGGKAGS